MTGFVVVVVVVIIVVVVAWIVVVFVCSFGASSTAGADTKKERGGLQSCWRGRTRGNQ
jgi:heme/copper-type cytochrome/quinol oxidase subunit 2